MKPRISLSLLTWIGVASFSLISIPSLHARNVLLSQSDADNGTRYITAKISYTYYETYILGEGGADFTMNGSITFSGYNYNYPDQTKHPDDGWQSQGTPVMGPLLGNVFQFFGGAYGAEPSSIKGDAGKTYDLTFENNHSLRDKLTTKDPNGGHAEGGAVSFADITTSNLKSLNFRNNSISNVLSKLPGAASQCYAFGGAMSTSGSWTLSDINRISFEGNLATSNSVTFGGALYSIQIRAKDIGEVIFQNNRSEVIEKGASAYGGAVANMDGDSTRGHIWTNVGYVLFENNKVQLATTISGSSTSSGRLFGGAYYGYSVMEFENSGNIEFIGNRADGSHHTNTNVDARGGAVYALYFILDGIEDRMGTGTAILIRDNAALKNGAMGTTSRARGGGFCLFSPRIWNSGNVLFENNYATDLGGAIYQDSSVVSKGGDGWFMADKGDITFRGNTHKLNAANDRNSGIANAIYVKTGTIDRGAAKLGLRSQDGFSINFYDNIESDSADAETFLIAFGTKWVEPAVGVAPDPRYDGTVRFSGEFVEDTLSGSEGSADYADRVAASKKSAINAAMSLNSGTLILEHGVTLGRKFNAGDSGAGTGAVFSFNKGVLDISGSARHGDSTLCAEKISFVGGLDSTLKAGTGARLEAGSIDFSKGLNLDLSYYTAPDAFINTGGIKIQADSMTLGGSLGIADDVFDHYGDNKWANKVTFTLMDISVADPDGITGDFEGIKSKLADSNIIDSPYTYTGSWELVWNGTKLDAVWTPTAPPAPPVDPDQPVDPEQPIDPHPPTPGIREIYPEMAGRLVLNSLWSSISNVNALGTTALSQIGLERFQLQKDSNYWVSGLGDFSSHDTVNGRDGYDYSGGGYAVGADSKLTENVIFGVAFGNIFGKNASDSYNAQIDQESYMGMIYGAGYKKLDEKNSLFIQGSAAYGLTDNSMDTFYSHGGHSRGSWDNNTFQLTLKAVWDHALENNWMISPFLGTEYEDAQQKAFTETGAYTRSFGEGHLRNLSLPIGVSLSKLVNYDNGMKWINSLSVSYVPDVYRENPEASATRHSNGFAWTAEGSKLARNAARIDLNTRLILNETWSTFAGYSLEGRSNSLYQRVNLGVSATF